MNPILVEEGTLSQPATFLYNTIQPNQDENMGMYPDQKIFIADDFTQNFDDAASSNMINSCDKRRKSP